MLFLGSVKQKRSAENSTTFFTTPLTWSSFVARAGQQCLFPLDRRRSAMFVQILSQVQRGVSVLRAGQIVGARLVDSYLAGPRMPAIHVSLRPSEQESRRARVDQPSADNPPANRAGRPACAVGVLSARTPTSTVGRPIPSGWSWEKGGSSLTAATTAATTARVASVGKSFPAGLPVRFGRSPLAAVCRPSWTKPAGRTPPASRWGQGS